ncbi:MAG: hypothetical protein DI536_33255 [Archangium gephyra]|uniref:Uncharacterized protein n=1 Tax=Archangium gephyra TaxID=48 RepID=A0A2W5T0A6_9BACT|nr:MAG: hypothetical protein DI536_33255 [Archangium gephyra]
MLDVAWVLAGPHPSVADLRAFFKLLGSPLDTAKGINIEAVMFHMHTLGERATRGSSRPSRATSRGMKCTFDNEGGSSDVNGGENASQEMCVANLLSSE